MIENKNAKESQVLNKMLNTPPDKKSPTKKKQSKKPAK